MPEKTEIKKFPTQIKENSCYNFSIENSGIYFIEIIASCKNWRQNWRCGFNDDDLAVKIDDIEFPKLNGKDGLLNGEAAWNGNNLKGAKKIGIFVLELKAGNHKINFIPNKNPLVHSVNIKKIENNLIEYILKEENKQAEDGNNRQRIAIALNDLPLKNLYINAKAGGESRDRDDIKLIIDGEIQKNPSKSPKYKNWHWAGNLLAGQFLTFEKDLNLPKNLHYIELWADKTPILERIKVILKENKEEEKREDSEKLKPLKAKVVWNSVKIRKEPEINEENVLEEIKQGEEVLILEKAVKGERPRNSSGVLLSSNRWHKASYNDQAGYIYSEGIEIENEDIEKIRELIIRESQKLELDPEILLALANCESQFFPYTVSYDNNAPEVAFGVMQISKDLFVDLNDPTKSFYSPFEDIFNIEKNIQGGAKYFEYLYNGKYKDDPDRLRKTIAAYNSGPGNVSLNKPLNLNLHDEQTKRLVNCVLSHLDKKTFKGLLKKFYPIILLALIGVSILIFRSNCAKTESVSAYLGTLYVSEDFDDNIFPKATWDKNDKTISFWNKERLLDGFIDSNSLKLDIMFQIPPDAASAESIRIGSDVIEYPENIYYFLASTFYMCGAQNCRWVLYKYDIENNLLEIVDDNIFGTASLYPNPDFSKIAILRHVHGGHCNSGEYISVIDLQNFKKDEVSGIKKSYDTSYINSFNWIGNSKFNFEIFYSDCGIEKENLTEALEYDTEKNILRNLIK